MAPELLHYAKRLVGASLDRTWIEQGSKIEQGEFRLTGAAHLTLQLGNAAAAIIVVDDDRYLLQLRDSIPGIWYPGHWGLFGGGVETGEDEITALRRELREEIGLDLEEKDARLFTRFDFDLRPVGKDRYFRSYYEVRIPAAVTSSDVA
jgi:8-oxo-dGTP pyrophosphatase MutT (NUDIX family)